MYIIFYFLVTTAVFYGLFYSFKYTIILFCEYHCFVKPLYCVVQNGNVTILGKEMHDNM